MDAVTSSAERMLAERGGGGGEKEREREKERKREGEREREKERKREHAACIRFQQQHKAVV